LNCIKIHTERDGSPLFFSPPPLFLTLELTVRMGIATARTELLFFPPPPPLFLYDGHGGPSSRRRRRGLTHPSLLLLPPCADIERPVDLPFSSPPPSPLDSPPQFLKKKAPPPFSSPPFGNRYQGEPVLAPLFLGKPIWNGVSLPTVIWIPSTFPLRAL